jgi:hypothetical protein
VDAVGGKDAFLLLEIVFETKEERQTLMVWMRVTSEVEGLQQLQHSTQVLDNPVDLHSLQLLAVFVRHE